VREELRKLLESRTDLKQRMVSHFVQLLPDNEILLVCAYGNAVLSSSKSCLGLRGGWESNTLLAIPGRRRSNAYVVDRNTGRKKL